MALEFSEVEEFYKDLKSQTETLIDSVRGRSYDQPMTGPTKDEMNARLEASEARVDARLANFDTSVKTGFAELRTEFAEMRAEMANARTDAAKQSHASTIWIIGSVFALLSVSVGILAAIINYNKSESKAAPVGATPQVIFTVPATAAPVSLPPHKPTEPPPKS